MGHYEELKTQNLGMDSDLYLVLKAKLMHQKSTEEVTIIGIPPITIISNGNNATVGLKGNTVQSGTPTPDSSVMPQDTGERTENLFDKNAPDRTTAGYIKSDGSIQGSINFSTSGYIPIGEFETITLSGYNGGNEPAYCLFDSNKEYISGSAYTGRTTITVTVGTAAFIRISYRNTAADTTMVNTGSTALPYEPFGVKIPISSASTTTPVYLGEVQTTRNIKKLVFDGTENWQFFQDTIGAWQFYVGNMEINGVVKSSALSNIAPYGANSDTRHRYDYGCYLVNNGIGVAFQMKGAIDTFQNITAWKAYLAAQYAAGTPVTVWYVLATPTTGIVNEPLMRIGDYADEVSGITIPTVKGINVVDVDTEVKPSEISITYTKGKRDKYK